MLRMRIILCRANTLNMPCSSSFLYLTLYINIKMIENIGQVHACLFCAKIIYPIQQYQQCWICSVLTFVPVYSLFFMAPITPARYAFVCRYFTIQCDKSTEKPRPRSLNVKENEDVDDAVGFCKKNFDTHLQKSTNNYMFIHVVLLCAVESMYV